MCFAFIQAEKLDKDKNADQVAKSWGTVGNCSPVLLVKMMYGRNTVCALPILQEDILQWKKAAKL